MHPACIDADCTPCFMCTPMRAAMDRECRHLEVLSLHQHFLSCPVSKKVIQPSLQCRAVDPMDSPITICKILSIGIRLRKIAKEP
eukprot:2050228-Pyramimonas_sp.AAC.2